MEFKLNKPEDYITTQWSGGNTTQLGIFPEGEVYADRNFIWRLSSATVDVEESDFTSLPDYNRILAVLNGEVVLAYEGIRTVKLKRLEYDYFDGAYNTKSYGKITDYNLMTRKGYNGKLEVLELANENQTLELAPALSRGFFCTGGYAVVSFDGNSVMVRDGEQLIINHCPIMTVSYMGEGALIHTEVSQSPAALDAEKERPRPVSASGEETAALKGDASLSGVSEEEMYPYKGKSDFGVALMLSLTDFRFGKHIYKRLKTLYFDEELDMAMEKINRFYLPFFVGVIGVVVLAILGLDRISTGTIIGAIVAWLIVDAILVSPLIYKAFLPKNVWQHIKDDRFLNAEEQEYYQYSHGRNARLEKIMKKYEGSGKNLGM